MNANAIRYGAALGVVAGFAWWVYRKTRLRKVSADSTAYIDTATVDGEIFIGAPELKIAAVPLIESYESSPLDFIAVTARKIAATISAWTQPRGESYRPLFDAAEAKNGIPHGLLFRLAYQESRFRDDIINGSTRSAAGAVGIMQIVPRWHPELGESGALDPQRAIPYAGKYLASLRKRFGNWELALAAYNAGPGNVEKYKGIPPFPETQQYVAQITADVPVKGIA